MNTTENRFEKVMKPLKSPHSFSVFHSCRQLHTWSVQNLAQKCWQGFWRGKSRREERREERRDREKDRSVCSEEGQVHAVFEQTVTSQDF